MYFSVIHTVYLGPDVAALSSKGREVCVGLAASWFAFSVDFFTSSGGLYCLTKELFCLYSTPSLDLTVALLPSQVCTVYSSLSKFASSFTDVFVFFSKRQVSRYYRVCCYVPPVASMCFVDPWQLHPKGYQLFLIMEVWCLAL